MRERSFSSKLFSEAELSDPQSRYQKLNEYILPFFSTLLRQIKTRESNTSTRLTIRNSARRALKKMNQDQNDEIAALVIQIAQLDGNTELDYLKAIPSLQKQLNIFDRYSKMLKYHIDNED